MQINRQQQNEVQEVSINDYLSVLFLYKKTVVWAFLSVFLGTAVYTFFMTPIYEAVAKIHVRDDRTKTDQLESLLMNKQSPIETELEILTSRTNRENVVRKLHLDWRISKKTDGLHVRILEFTSTSPDPSYTVKLTGAGSYQVFDSSDVNVGQGKVNELMQGKGVNLFIAEINGRESGSFRLMKSNFDDTVEVLGKSIKAVESGNKTNIINVSYRDSNPEKAAAVINTLSAVYLEQNRGFKNQGAVETVKFLDEQLGNLRIDLNDSEKNLEQYKVSTGMMDLGANTLSIIQKLSEIEKDRKDVSLLKKQTEFALENLKEAIQKKVIYSPANLNNDPLMGVLAAKLSELQTQKNALLSEYNSSHPSVRLVQAQIDDLQRTILTTYESQLKSLVKAEANLGLVMSQYEGKLRKLPTLERQQATLLRRTKVNQDVYAFLLQKREESRIAAASTFAAVNIIDPAIVPQKPVKPMKGKNIFLGLILGCMVGVGAAFLRNMLDDTIKDAEMARRVMGLPLFSHIPHIGGKDDKQAENALIVHKEPKAPASEAFRGLRTAIHYSAITSHKQVILITSTFPGEGKSTVIANLALTMAQTGAKVLLMDCDLRRPSLHEIFGHSKVPGLSEILVGDVEFDKSIHNTGIPGLDFVSSGTTPPNPSELLGSPQMNKLLESLRDRYAYILLDAPPVLAVTDAPLLAAAVSMVIVVMEAGRVPVKAAQRVNDLLAGIGKPAAGLVFNNKTTSSELYGYGYGYGYRYSYKYGYYGEKKKVNAKKWQFWKK